MGERTCVIDGCSRRHYGRGWCQMHYKRWYATGNSLALPRRLETEQRTASHGP